MLGHKLCLWGYMQCTQPKGFRQLIRAVAGIFRLSIQEIDWRLKVSYNLGSSLERPCDLYVYHTVK